MRGAKRLIAFINPPGPKKLYRSMTCTYVSKANYIWQPHDFVGLSSQIPAEWELVFHDASLTGLSREALFFRLDTRPPDAAVLAFSSIVYHDDLAFVRSFRERYPETVLFLIGDIFLEEVFRFDCLAECDAILLNSIDSGLAPFLESGRITSPNLVTYASGAWETSREIASKRVASGVPRHAAFLDRRYRFPFSKGFLYTTVATQFGCPFSCSYCTQCRIPVTWRPWQEVIEELALVRSLRVRDLFFWDPSFGFPKENAVALLEEMLRRDFGFRWTCYANPGLLDDAMLGLMARAGCHTAMIGVEDQDTEMLKSAFRRNVGGERISGFCAGAKRAGIRVCGDFIIGLNSDTAAVERMVEFARTLKLDFASFNLLTPLLGSGIRADMVAAGKLDPRSVGADTSGTFGCADKDMLALKNRAVRSFYLRPGYLLRRLAGITTREELVIQLEEMAGLFRKSRIGQAGS